jgi:hypothetical protein
VCRREGKVADEYGGSPGVAADHHGVGAGAPVPAIARLVGADEIHGCDSLGYDHLWGLCSDAQVPYCSAEVSAGGW